MTTKADLIRRLSRVEETTGDQAVIIVTTEEEAAQYQGTGRIVIIDDIREVEP